MTLVGTWAAHIAEAAIGTKDPGAIVIDEVAGMTLSLLVLPLPFTVPVLLVGFALFRIFDVVKPFPARRERGVAGAQGGGKDERGAREQRRRLRRARR